MYLTLEAAAYMSRRSRATSRPKRPQGDLRTTDCQESIIGLIITVAIVGDATDATGMLLKSLCLTSGPGGGDDDAGEPYQSSHASK